MEAPKVIWARPVGASKDWSDYTSGPWSMKNPYGTSARYIRTDAPELVALVGFVQWLNSCIDANITENETGENRLLLNDGSVYTGPAVDWMHKVLTGIRDISDKNLAAWEALSGMDLELEGCEMEDDTYYVARLEVAFSTKDEAKEYINNLLAAWCDMPMNEDKGCTTGVHKRKIEVF